MYVIKLFFEHVQNSNLIKFSQKFFESPIELVITIIFKRFLLQTIFFLVFRNLTDLCIHPVQRHRTLNIFFFFISFFLFFFLSFFLSLHSKSFILSKSHRFTFYIGNVTMAWLRSKENLMSFNTRKII